jgi:iron complex outermembrane receptor protein
VVSGSRAPTSDAPRSDSRPDLAQAFGEGGARLEDLAAQVPGMQPLVADGGLTGSISLRGFGVSRFYINGLRDVNRLFVRDLATVASVQVLRGPDALATGFNSPGGTVWFEGLQPEWRSRQRISLGAGSGEGWRAGIDSTGPLALGADADHASPPLAYRVLLQWHDGHSQPGDLRLARHTALAALAWRDERFGLLTLEAEHQHNHQPFLFGTVVVDGRVRHDQLYASTAQQSRRITGRQGLHWQQAWALADGDRLQLRADAGGAQVQRDETLIGFFSQRTPTLLSGYYTRYHDADLQHDARLWAQWQSTLAGLPHTLSATWARSAQRFVFEGVQNIGGFDVALQVPDFSAVDPAALALSPRYRSERSTERAWSLHDALRLPGGWTLQAGLGALAYRVDADRTRAGLRPAGRVAGRTGQLGLARAWPDGLVAYLDHSRALEPNRGTTRLGDWLPPQQALQWEVGLRQPAGDRQPAWQLAGYRITQDNLPLPDPLDRTAFITTGVRRVQGLEASGAARWGAWQWQAQAHLLQADNLRKTVPGQGDGFPGVAGRGAALRAEGPLPGAAVGDLRLWLQWQALGPRWADLANSLRLPGHALAGLGLRWQPGGWVVNAGVHNLFNRDHVATVTALDNVYQGPQRRWWISVASRP